MHFDSAGGEVGYDIPALPGMDEAQIQTPCLVLDLDALERNIRKMGEYAKAHRMRHRSHGKMHKSVDVQKLQEKLGGAAGVCCQKVSEAEVFARGGIRDILVSNQVRDPLKIDRLARLPRYGTRISVCVDDIANVSGLSAAAQRHGTTLECLVEIDCGAGRCGVTTSDAAIEIARAIDAAPSLEFSGIQAYQGAMQHLERYEDRKARLDAAIKLVKTVVAALESAGLKPELVSGGGTGSYRFESNSGVYNELQCGSYAFVDADYGRIRDKDDERIDRSEWENALFVLTSVMSHAKPALAVCDAGLKAMSLDSGLPVVHGRDDVKYLGASDEHGIIEDKRGQLRINEKLKLVPATATRPATCMTGTSACATARSKWSGRCPRAERAIERWWPGAESNHRSTDTRICSRALAAGKTLQLAVHGACHSSKPIGPATL
jgi:3-hydroxy-D-aspartate aldolase